MSVPWLARLALAAVVLLPASEAVAQTASETQPRRSVEVVATPPADMAFDRIEDGLGVWRLDRHVRTVSSATPAEPRGVYIQFGFMSYGPCHVLAEHASRVLGDQVERVYLHLDDIEMGDALDPTPMWARLRTFLSERAEYAGYIGLIRGNSRLMRQLTGPGNPPHALLIHPDGTHTVLRSPSPADAEQVFQRFLEQLHAP